MLQFIIERQSAGKVTKIEDLAKKFKMKNAEVWDMLDKGFEGFTVGGLENGAAGKNEITITENTVTDTMTPEYVTEEALDALEASCDEIIEELNETFGTDLTETPEYTEDADTTGDDLDSRDVEAEIDEAAEQVAATKRAGFAKGIYPSYATMEEAIAAHPEGITRLKDVRDVTESLGISFSKFYRAFGENKMKFEPRNANWIPFTVGTATTRYVSANVKNDYDAMLAEPVVRGRAADPVKAAKRQEEADARAAAKAAKEETRKQKIADAEAAKAAKEETRKQKIADAEAAKAAKKAEREAAKAAKKAAEADSGIPLLA